MPPRPRGDVPHLHPYPHPSSTSTLAPAPPAPPSIPPPLPLHLHLDPPPTPPLQEEDIGDLSPYLGFPSSTSTSTTSTASLSSAASVSTAGSVGARWRGGLAGGSRERERESRERVGYGYGYHVFGEEDEDEGQGDEGERGVSSPSRIREQGEGEGEGETPRRTTFVPPPASQRRRGSKEEEEEEKLSRSRETPKAQEKKPEKVKQQETSGTPPHPRKIHTEIHALGLDVDPAAVAKMRRWILGIAIVEFDLDTGPVVDGVYPPLALLPAEAENIAFCALPDSLQFDQGSQTHSFRVRAQPRRGKAQENNGAKEPEKEQDAPTTLDGFIYGFSHFVQRRDAKAKRGYHQRAVVILTQHAYPALFTALAALFGPLFEQHGTPMLEAACHNIATWPPPQPGTTRELGFLGTVLPVELPHSQDAQQVAETSSFGERYDVRAHILATLPPFRPPPLLLFEASLSHLWSIWECLVLCEPILIFGASPAQTSQAVWWLRDLVRPIPLAGDIRPYFTMQDADHGALVNRLPPKPGLLLGVTNPFFERSCAHWPHVLSLGRVGRGGGTSSTSPKQKSPTLGAPVGPPPGWTTKTHRRYISKDRALLRRLEGVLKKGAGDERERTEVSLALRKHFCTRSTQLITPLARYLNTLIPSPEEVHGHRAAVAGHARTETLTPRQSQKGTGTQKQPQAQAQTWSVGSGLRYLASTASLPAQTQKQVPSPANSTGSSPVPSFRSVNAVSMSSTSTSTPGSNKPGTSTATATTTTPSNGSASSKPKDKPLLRLKPFNSAAFLASLKTYSVGGGGIAGSGNGGAGVGSLLPFKSASKRVEFYERWLKSPAFATWLAQQEQIVLSVLNEPPASQPQQQS